MGRAGRNVARTGADALRGGERARSGRWLAGRFRQSRLAGLGAHPTVAVELHPIGAGLAVVEVARRLERHSAYDAAYVVLAQALSAELWTFDGPLARNARGINLPVRLLAAD